jgi:hypothetical protein
VVKLPDIPGTDPEEIGLGIVAGIEQPFQAGSDDLQVGIDVRAQRLAQLGMDPPFPAVVPAGTVEFQDSEKGMIPSHDGWFSDQGPACPSINPEDTPRHFVPPPTAAGARTPDQVADQFFEELSR